MEYITHRLKEVYKKYKETHLFKPGDILKWKPYMKNTEYYGPFVVLSVSADGSILELGTINSTDSFCICKTEGFRLEPAEDDQ